MIHLIRSRATPQQIEEMREELQDCIKVAVDVRLGILAGGGELHSDCEQELFDHGSQKDDIWGATWEPDLRLLTFDSMLNLKPRKKNFSRDVTDPAVRRIIQELVTRLLEGV